MLMNFNHWRSEWPFGQGGLRPERTPTRVGLWIKVFRREFLLRWLIARIVVFLFGRGLAL